MLPALSLVPTAQSVASDPAAQPLALYVHWPFCKAKCPYCDFNSHVRDTVDQARWATALVRELDHVADAVGRRPVPSVFFGGGTPSLMAPATVAAVLDRAAARFTLAPDCEITLEANPTSAEAQAFQGFRAAGVNRVSLGVQALNDADLRFLGRQHSAVEARAAAALAARTFQRFSLDLIYARPDQTVAAWIQELQDALTLTADHVSVYQLTLEAGTAFEARARRGALTLPDEDTQATLFEATQALLADAGLPAYEISNHARPGSESRHNLAYWTYRDYAGIGPGAHGRLTLGGQRLATRTHRAPEIWLDRVDRAGHGEHPRTPVVPETAVEEAIMMGLRLTAGIDLADLDARLGVGVRDRLNPAALGRLVAAGLLTLVGTRLAATADGRQRLNGVLSALLA